LGADPQDAPASGKSGLQAKAAGLQAKAAGGAGGSAGESGYPGGHPGGAGYPGQQFGGYGGYPGQTQTSQHNARTQLAIGKKPGGVDDEGYIIESKADLNPADTAGELPGTKREELPIDKHRQLIVNKVRKYPTICIQGETGCGKSSRVPQYLHYFCRNNKTREKTIVITQPRRLACITLAQRVAKEMKINKKNGPGSGNQKGKAGLRTDISGDKSKTASTTLDSENPFLAWDAVSGDKKDESGKSNFEKATGSSNLI
jgi:hypothetical protein